MKHTISIALIAALAAMAAVPALAASPSGTAARPLISRKSKGEVAIVPVSMAGGELMFKVVAVNRMGKPAHFGPKDIQVFAAGAPVPLMTLDQLIAQAKRSGAETAGSATYDNPGMGGPTVSHNMAGQPNLQNFAGGDTASGEVSVQRSGGGPGSRAVKRRIAGLEAAILRDVTISPGAIKGGEVITKPFKFRRHASRTVRVQIQFNGERHTFRFAAPAGR